MPEQNPQFLQHKYGLHRSPEVDRVADRTADKTVLEIGVDLEARIKNYLDYVQEIVELDYKHKRGQQLNKE